VVLHHDCKVILEPRVASHFASHVRAATFFHLALSCFCIGAWCASVCCSGDHSFTASLCSLTAGLVTQTPFSPLSLVLDAVDWAWRSTATFLHLLERHTVASVSCVFDEHTNARALAG